MTRQRISFSVVSFVKEMSCHTIHRRGEKDAINLMGKNSSSSRIQIEENGVSGLKETGR